MAFNWKSVALPYSSAWRKVLFLGNDIFLFSNRNLIVSQDRGLSWTDLTDNLDISYTERQQIDTDGQRIVLTSYDYVCVSADRGRTWTKKQVPYNFSSLAYIGFGRFIMSDNNGVTHMTTDFETFDTVSTGLTAHTRFIYDGDRTVIAYVQRSSAAKRSTDNGATWSSIDLNYAGTSPYWTDGTYGDGRFIIIPNTQSGNFCQMSTDGGATWRYVQLSTEGAHSSISYGHGSFLILSDNSNKAQTSAGGQVYTAQYLPVTANWQDARAGAGLYIACASNIGEIAVAVFNDAPTPPTTITVPDAVQGGANVTVEWSAAVDPDGNLGGYILERSVNGDAWAEIYRGALRRHTDSIVLGWQTVVYRVKAYDSYGLESTYTTGEVRTVTNNTAPTISGSDGNLGSFSTAFTAQSYTVNDAQGGTVTVVERLDGVVKRTYNATLGTATNISFTAAEWRQVLNGPHTITITATDSQGLSTVRTWTFSKAMNTLTFTITPLPADAMPDRCVVDAVGNFPTGSTLKIEVCNNANDTSPRWEDVSGKLGEKHFFTNTSKTASAWAFGLRCTLTRGTATGAVWLDYITINYR